MSASNPKLQPVSTSIHHHKLKSMGIEPRMRGKKKHTTTSIRDKKNKISRALYTLPQITRSQGAEALRSTRSPVLSTSRKMHFPSCASGRIGRTGRKLKIMTEVTIAPMSGRTAPNPFVQDGPHPTLSFRVYIMTTPSFTMSKLALTTSRCYIRRTE